ncbi:uncharacterized protein LOC126991821 [Eriocheir sinensis]|uniref:uncharacterized protein LOC126991821 n=1 Tax=Eriocheir sinensis TaxID=95602 RepID=UPI0021CA5E09|nr:uncharacterized protein LOC126991821 [Eriocheir sinensis]
MPQSFDDTESWGRESRHLLEQANQADALLQLKLLSLVHGRELTTYRKAYYVNKDGVLRSSTAPRLSDDPFLNTGVLVIGQPCSLGRGIDHLPASLVLLPDSQTPVVDMHQRVSRSSH